MYNITNLYPQADPCHRKYMAHLVNGEQKIMTQWK